VVIKHDGMKAYGCSEGRAVSFLTSALYEGEW
jgi:hypothetical protein